MSPKVNMELLAETMSDVLEQLHAGIIIADLNGDIQYMNEVAVKQHGHSSKDDFLKNIREFGTIFEVRNYPEMEELPLKQWPLTRILNGEEGETKICLVRRSNGVRSVFRYSGRLIQDKENKPYLAVLTSHDITDQEIDRQKIIDEEERYQAFIENSSEAIWCFELEKPFSIKLPIKQQIDHMYEYGYLAEANQAMADMYGVQEPKDLIGMRLGDFLIRDDPRNLEYLKAFIKSGYRLSNMESHEVDSNGNDKIFRNSLVGIIHEGKAIRAWGTQQDITEQDKSQRELEKIIEQFRLLFNDAPEAIILSNDKGECRSINKATIQLLGYTEEEMLGKTLANFVAASELPRLLEARSQTLNSDAYSSEWLLTTKHNTTLLCEINSRRLSSGEWLAFVRDVSQRKQAEDALLASEERFRTLIEKSHDAIALVTADGHFEYVSPGVSDVLGFLPEELVGKDVFELIHPKEQAKLTEIFANITTRPNVSTTFEHLYKNNEGEYVWIESTARNLLNDTNINAIVSNFSNINDRRISENEIKYQAELLETVVATTTLGFYMLNEDQECFYMNSVAESMTGYTVEELKGRPLHDIIHHTYPDGTPYPKQKCPFHQKKSFGKQISGEEIFINRDGVFFPVRYNASPIIKNGRRTGMVIEMQDISEELASQQALVESNQRFKQLADSMPQIVWTSYPDGNNEYLNRRWYEFFGFKDDEDHNWEEILHPDDILSFRKNWQRSLRTGEPFEVESRFKDYKSDSYRWFLGRALPIRDDEGTILRWYGTCTDIDDVRRALQANSTLEQEAVRLTALNKAKDDFISLASHQLRTPATAVKAYTGMLLEGYAGEMSKTQIKFLKQAYESNERQLQTIDDLLNVAQIDTGQFVLNRQSADIVALMRDVIDEQTDKFKNRRQTVKLESSNMKIMATIDNARLRMVFENLIDNASKYSVEGTKIQVNLQTSGEKKVVITIQDEGVGIDKTDLDKLFQKFSRIGNLLSEAVGGTGLGLYWAKKIVDMHDGTISVHSEKGVGTIFTITLPLGD